jgi:hypothetical protein
MSFTHDKWRGITLNYVTFASFRFLSIWLLSSYHLAYWNRHSINCRYVNVCTFCCSCPLSQYGWRGWSRSVNLKWLGGSDRGLFQERVSECVKGNCEHSVVLKEGHVLQSIRRRSLLSKNRMPRLSQLDETVSVGVICNAYCLYGGPGSSVGIATGYGLDGPGMESRWGRDFPHLTRPAHPASCAMGTGSFPGVKAAGAWRWPLTFS